MSDADYEAGYKAGLRAAFGEASIQVLRDSDGYEGITPSKFEGEYGRGAAAVMNWLNEALDEPVPPREESHELKGPTCLTCGGAVKPCSGTHWHHVEQPAEPHFPCVEESRWPS